MWARLSLSRPVVARSRGLGLLDCHASCMGCERSQIIQIGSEYDAVGFGHGNDDRVHS